MSSASRKQTCRTLLRAAVHGLLKRWKFVFLFLLFLRLFICIRVHRNTEFFYFRIPMFPIKTIPINFYFFYLRQTRKCSQLKFSQIWKIKTENKFAFNCFVAFCFVRQSALETSKKLFLKLIFLKIYSVADRRFSGNESFGDPYRWHSESEKEVSSARQIKDMIDTGRTRIRFFY